MNIRKAKYRTSKSLLLALLLLAISYLGKLNAQERLILNNDVYVLLRNASFLVLDNSQSNALTVSGTGAHILSEAEHNILKWNIEDAVGNYTVPFINSNGTKIPVSLNISTAGSADGYINFSTLTDNDAVDSWNNEDYMPVGVTDMNASSGGGNNSAFVIDRFWVIDQESYTQNPTGIMHLAYDDAERLEAGNTISAGSMVAQYWDEDNATWGETTTGTDNYPVHEVSGIETGTHFYKYWTLSQEDHPLSLESTPSNPLQSDVVLYPNPARTYIRLAYLSPECDFNYQVFDISGKLVKADSFYSNARGTIKIAIEDLKAGIYYLRLQNQNTLNSFKFTKEQ